MNCAWCSRRSFRDDLCRDHYVLAAAAGRVPTVRGVVDRFEARLRRDGPVPEHDRSLGPCWVWDGPPSGPGYPQMSVGRDNPTYIHRLAWLLHHGEVPPRLSVLHHCDNKMCANYETHLYVGTPRQNHTDARARSTFRRYYHAKLSWEQVEEIRRMSATGRTGRSLARDFGVSEGTVSSIINRRHVWQHPPVVAHLAENANPFSPTF